MYSPFQQYIILEPHDRPQQKEAANALLTPHMGVAVAINYLLYKYMKKKKHNLKEVMQNLNWVEICKAKTPSIRNDVIVSILIRTLSFSLFASPPTASWFGTSGGCCLAVVINILVSVVICRLISCRA